ncbi:MAG: helix-turn-helix transcriptional regulator [Ruminococcus sp.]|nr:helix-turn-helix transcriptional regulator [Ruminococcus sp.]
MIDISENLKLLRKENHLTIQAVCDGAGIAIRTYQNYEYGKREISTEALQKLADYYNVSTDYLLGRPEAKPPEKPIDEFASKEKLKELEKILIEHYLKLTDVQRETILDFLRECVTEEEKRKQIQQKNIAKLAQSNDEESEEKEEIDEETLKIMRETEAKKASLLAILAEDENL